MSTHSQTIDDSNPVTSESVYAARQAKLAHELENAGLQALALNPGPSLTYLTGLHFHLMERPVVAFFVPHSAPVLVLPELETAKTENLAFAADILAYGEDPADWPAVFRKAAQAAQIDGRQVGVEPRRLRVLELRLLEAAAPEAQFTSAEESLAALRMRKDEGELVAMRKAVGIAQRALLATLPLIHIGMTERNLAAELTLQLLRLGSDPEFPFAPIVSFGSNSANPHAVPTERPLASGDLLLIDWGAAYHDYLSDLTRTFAVGRVPQEMAHIAEIVKEANSAARNAVRPGVTAHDVDQAARQVIEKAGYGQYFIHRTGHGLGMEAHEEPYMRAGNPLPLQPGMTFTIEPGIYLPGRGGVRIEDNIVVTLTGVESMSDLPRELVTAGI